MGKTGVLEIHSRLFGYRSLEHGTSPYLRECRADFTIDGKVIQVGFLNETINWIGLSPLPLEHLEALIKAIRDFNQTENVDKKNSGTGHMNIKPFKKESGQRTCGSSLNRKEREKMDEIKAGDHRKRHFELHKALDELLKDFITHTKALPSETSLVELLRWSFNQTLEPSETEEVPCPKKP